LLVLLLWLSFISSCPCPVEALLGRTVCKFLLFLSVQLCERSFNQDLYADYSGPDQAQSSGFDRADAGPPKVPFGPGGSGVGGGGLDAAPNQQIMVRNLPWSTANEDLVELFETTGQVEQAEILFEGTRSKGAGVVQFAQTAEAETAIAKFQGYMYGGRPLNVSFNDRWHGFSGTAAKGGSSGVIPILPE